MTTLVDDLGHPLTLDRAPTRVVSLVPSLSEALAATVPDRLVGVTDWCTHPAGLDVARVRGTKNPDLAAIGRLRPDLVVANKEENRRIDVERLRSAGTPVWVTAVESVDAALRSLHALMVDVLGEAVPPWLESAGTEWARPPVAPPLRVVVPIWRDPWMVIGARTFAGDIIGRLGLQNLAERAQPEQRYPRMTAAEVAALEPDLILLPDEPYPFAPDDGPEAFAGIRSVLVSGRDLTWYGPSMATARASLDGAVAAG